ncbi:MAG: adenylyltransferase/cytidyltransferase family protein [Terriglobales bacterium]
MAPLRDKILTRAALLEAAAGWRAAGGRLVLANGCFDILHVGHARYLEAARALGTHLIVAINSDRSTQALKGPGRPVLPEQARAELVAGLRAVTAVTIFDELSVEPLLRALRPHVHAKGTDYTAASVPEAAVARELGIEVAIVGDAKAHSTAALLERLRG